MSQFGFAFFITLLAGLSTGIGSAVSFFVPRKQMRYLSMALGFSAGVMIFLSFSDLLPNARDLLYNQQVFQAECIVLISFFAGIILTGLIDYSIPEINNPHVFSQKRKDIQLLREERGQPDKLLRTGLMTAGALALHNLPEGMATFMAGMQSNYLAYMIAFAVALHNIPEGIAVSIPIFYATGCRKKAFFYSFLSGLTEPLGAVIGYLFLYPFLTPVVLGVIFAVVAGIMVYISFDELLPTARKYGQHYQSLIGLFLGMLLMGVGGILF